MKTGKACRNNYIGGGYNFAVIGELTAPKFSGSVSMLQESYSTEIIKNTGMIYYHVHMIVGNYFNELRNQNCISAHPFPPLKGEQNEKYASEMRATESVALHVRRGDFVKLDWAMPPDSYKIAVDTINKHIQNPTYFIFSDDLNFCKEHIDEMGLTRNNVIFVEGNESPDNYIDMQLMTICKHRIVNNSSFCYCAALYREDRDGIMVNLNSNRPIF